MNVTPAKRQKIINYLVDLWNRVDPTGINSNIVLKTLPKMTDEQLISYCSKPIPLYAPNGGKVKIDHMRNIQILREMGYEPFQRIWITDPVTGVTSLTKFPHMVLPCPVRRQTQLIEKKISIPENNRSIDKTTGQVTGKSKGSSFSFPQTYVIYSAGYVSSIKEMLIDRGGNVKAGQVIDRQIRQYGHSSQQFEGKERTHVKSSMTLSAQLTAQHLKNNVGK